jgi:hypothetical protein
MTSGCSRAPIAYACVLRDAEPMQRERADEIEAPPTAPGDEAAIRAGPTTDEVGEASFPASDPPSSWTWDVAGRPPGSETR